MKIALLNENSQCTKNSEIEASLKRAVCPLGHTVDNYGMYGPQDDESLTYVQIGILAAILLNSGAADYVITGCGTGEGAMLACNSFPGVLCGHVEDVVDAYTFAQVNDGNCVAMPFAKGCGWGMELNWEYIFEKLFSYGSGNGYPAERAQAEQNNKKILDKVRACTHQDLLKSLNAIEYLAPEEEIFGMERLVSHAVSAPGFKKIFADRCPPGPIKDYVQALWNESVPK